MSSGATPKIVRNSKEYNLPDYTPSRRKEVPQYNYSNYYLNNLSLPRISVNVNLMKDRSPPLRSPKTERCSPHIGPIIEGLADLPQGPVLVDFAEAKGRADRAGPRKDRGKWVLPTIVQFRSRRHGHKDSQKFCAIDFGKVKDLREIFRRISPEKYCKGGPELVGSDKKSPRFVDRISPKNSKLPERKLAAKHKTAAELLEDHRGSSNPLGIYETFGEMVDINMQHVAKAVRGNREEKCEAMLLREEDMHVDLCELNDQLRHSPDSALLLSDIKFRRNSQPCPSDLLPTISDASPTSCRNRNNNLEEEEAEKPDACPLAETDNAEKQKPPPPAAMSPKSPLPPASDPIPKFSVFAPVPRVSPIRKHATQLEDAEVRALGQMVRDRAEGYRKVKEFCQRCRYNLVSKNLVHFHAERDYEREVEEIKREAFSPKKAQQQRRGEERGRVAKLAAMQVLSGAFNIKRRYNADTVSISKYRREVVQRQKMEEEMCADNGDTLKAKARNDLLVSKVLHKRNKSVGHRRISVGRMYN